MTGRVILKKNRKNLIGIKSTVKVISVIGSFAKREIREGAAMPRTVLPATSR
jgi:hypothetical protein